MGLVALLWQPWEGLEQVVSLWYFVCVKMSFLSYNLTLSTGLVFQERGVSLESQLIDCPK